MPADAVVALSYCYNYAFRTGIYLYDRVSHLFLHVQVRFCDHVRVQKGHGELKHQKVPFFKKKALLLLTALICCV